MSDDILKAIAALGEKLSGEIAKLGTDLREEIAQSRGETARLHRLNRNTRDEARDIANSLADIERILREHGTRLDDLEKRVPKP